MHSRIGTTTVYVTHDQVEAMTLGMRVSVMRDGRIQQVDVPQRLYDEPANLFVAAFIGSPAMNLAEGTIAEDTVSVGTMQIPLARDRRPPGVPDGRVIVGIRPEAFEDVAFASSDLPQFDVQVDVLEELGSDAFVFFGVDAQTLEVEGAGPDEEGDESTILAAERDRTLFAARVDPRTDATIGATTRLAVDPSRLYFFSPATGENLLNGSAVAA
jgi:multiple sugar transport system ATP-binding protein